MVPHFPLFSPFPTLFSIKSSFRFVDLGFPPKTLRQRGCDLRGFRRRHMKQRHRRRPVKWMQTPTKHVKNCVLTGID